MNSSPSIELSELIQFNRQVTDAKIWCDDLTHAEFSNKLTALAVQLRNEGRFDDAALIDRTAGLIYVF